LGADPSRSIRVGGPPIRRIVILTHRLEPCACYLARRLRDCGAEITIVSQRRLRVELDSPAYFRRLFARRGVRIGVDYLLLHLVKSAWRLAGRARGSNGEAPSPMLRPDPGIRKEDWLRVVDVDDVNRPPGQDLLRDLDPDLVLLAGAPVLGRKTIDIARVACLNPHCGITPDYAGSSPFDWPIYERRFDDVGYTVHLVVPTVDGGPVLRQERVAWDPRKSNGNLWPLLAERMYDALADIARALVRGETFEAHPQPPVRVNPPAGLFARLLAERRRAAYARKRGRA
jgi:formyl transferase-like protein